MTHQNQLYTPPSATRRPRRKTIIIAALASIAVAAIVAGSAIVVINRRNHQEAFASCQIAQQSYDKSSTKAGEARKAAQQLAESTKKETLQDPQTLTTLNTLIDHGVAKTESICTDSMNTAALRDATSKLNSLTKKHISLASNYVKASDALAKSAAAKRLADAKITLTDDVTDATSLLNNSNGKVADNATRDSLSRQIGVAKEVLGRKNVTIAKTYIDAKSSLDTAVKQVNDSISQKSKSDAEAQAAAERAASSRNTQSYPSSSGSIGRSKTYSNSPTGSTGSYGTSHGSGSGGSTNQKSNGASGGGDTDLSFCGTTDGTEFKPC